MDPEAKIPRVESFFYCLFNVGQPKKSTIEKLKSHHVSVSLSNVGNNIPEKSIMMSEQSST